MHKSELYKIFNKLEKEHLNLYHSINKEDFQKEVDKVAERIENLDENKVNYELSRLVALIKDGHTRYSIPRQRFPIEFIEENGKLYIKGIHYNFKNLMYKEVTSINGIDIIELFTKMQALVSAEIETWRKKEALYEIVCVNHLKMLGINCEKEMAIEVEGQKYLIPNELRKFYCDYEQRKPNYKYSMYKNIPYLEYTKCRESEDYKLSAFIEDLNKQLKENSTIIIDLRDNGGGSDFIFRQILNKCIKPKKLKGYVLINAGCFSATLFAINDLSQLNFKFIGTEPGGLLKSYGQMKELEIENKKFSVSVKYFDKNENNDNVIFHPDIFVKNSIEDYRVGYDRQLETAVDLIQKESESIAEQLDKIL